MTTPARLSGEALRVGYSAQRTVLHDVDVVIPEGELTVIVGPNACGKSTLLKTLARMLQPQAGLVLLDGQPIGKLAPKAVARRLGLLPQGPTAPDGITVSDLVARGRYPHQNLLRQWSKEDERAVLDALVAANVAELADRNVDELSGGQRQRVWVAMALAQETPLLLLDEPTTYLDVAHQIEVLNLTRRLHREGRTVVLVLHELHLAFRYATHLIVMRDGVIVAEGRPEDIVTAELIERVYDLPCQVIPDPVTGRPLVLPLDIDAL
ncbi:ABC transporter ATP-binding protein [Tessaracoccus caeni]|uniref:ABC transporter ATP-binding protein n=1 Tax=Tessaracoccus caeni TaxID=3031239 RepID=UPI0023DB4CB8|nr:ABC transporter ATP-binding protein [Tessaracoccus caeni]MDF1487420.1 ABC transporter ATP-binding protein [Tessaracoccus caeni]